MPHLQETEKLPLARGRNSITQANTYNMPRRTSFIAKRQALASGMRAESAQSFHRSFLKGDP
jgi:hypothetical protein